MKKTAGIPLLLSPLILILTAMFFFPRQDYSVQAEVPHVGEIARETIVATVTFDIPKSTAELEKERKNARDGVSAYFEYNEDRSNEIKERFDTLLANIKEYSLLLVRLQNESDSETLTASVTAIFQKLSRQISTTAIYQLSQSARGRDSLSSAFHQMLDAGISARLVTQNTKSINLYKKVHNLDKIPSLIYNKSEIILIRNNQEERLAINKLSPREAAVELWFNKLQLEFPRSQSLQSAFYEVLYAFSAANIFYLEQFTKQQKEKEANSVNPTKGKVVKGMEIVRRGDIITPDIIEKLTSMQQTLNKEQSSWKTVLPEWSIRISIIILLVFFIWSYIFFHKESRRKIAPNQVWALTTILTLQILLFFIGFYFEEKLNRIFLGLLSENIASVWLHPYLVAPILTTMLLGFKAGLASALFTSTYLGILSGYDLTITIGAFFISSLTIYFLRSIRYRNQFLIASGTAVLSFLLYFTLTAMLRGQLHKEFILYNTYAGAAMILVSSAISFLFLAHFFEKLFHLTTNLTLMELADFNHPLLRQFSINAPGSFHHSIMVANLAEKAAQRINANTLLTRVMALYHDVGKGDNSQYFIENQKGDNPHEIISPLESARRIRNHVSRGLELGKEYRLPPRLLQAIPEHHGDSLIQYFYKKALDRASDPKEVRKEDFCYEGPRPQSKETAIIMLADSVEAVFRTLSQHNAEDLVYSVQKILHLRIYDNQLSESGLTLRDLREIEIGFLQALEGMYHTRIPYPEGIFPAMEKK
jgi:putative nucleotidyltransferase with HDIG domain